MSLLSDIILGLKKSYGETCRPVKRTKNRYLVSKNGKVFSLSTGRSLRPKPLLLKPHTDKKGYQQVILKVDGVSLNARVHRLVSESFLGLRVGSPKQVHHKDFNPRNNKVSNLIITDSKTNVGLSRKSKRHLRRVIELDCLEKGIKLPKRKVVWE